MSDVLAQNDPALGSNARMQAAAIERALDQGRPAAAAAHDQACWPAAEAQRDNGKVRSNQGPGQFMLCEIAR